MNSFTVTLNYPPSIDPAGFEIMGIKACMKTTKESIKLYEGEITLIFDGYIHNLHTLHRNISWVDDDENTHGEQSQYSIIIDIYREFGIEYLLQVLDGTFTFVLLDQRLTMDDSKIYIVSDPMGVRPLYKITEHSTNTSTGDIYTFTTDKPNDIGPFSLAYSSSMGTCDQLILTNRVRSYWTLENPITYSLLGKSGGFPCIMYHPDSNITHDFEEFVKTMTEYQLSSAVDKYISVYPKKSTIFCIVSHDDYESQIIANLATRISMKDMNPDDEEEPHINIPPVANQPDEYYEGSLNIQERYGRTLFGRISNNITENDVGVCRNIVKISIDQFVKENTYSDDLIQHFIRDSCDRYMKANNNSQINSICHIWMSSGLLNRENKIKQTCQNIMDYDHKFCNYLTRIGPDHLIPNIIEPCKKMGLEVAFPLLEKSWIQYYLSIHPLYRYTTSIIQERVGSVREKGRTLFGRISNIPENDVGVCRNIEHQVGIYRIMYL